ncbi:co-chaperone GroES [Candidatus Gracilibacteria bacterium]|nr:MAG: co-chaperone GroES [Candidatus Gracilibacteria bacterium]
MSLTSQMIPKITPLSDRILLKPVEEENITKAGIILPESENKDRTYLYEVIAVGPGKHDNDGNHIKIELKTGDKIISGQYSGDDVKIDDTTYKILAYEYVLAKVGE